MSEALSFTADTATFFQRLREKCFAIVADSRRQIFACGLVLFINYPLYYFIWLYTTAHSHQSVALRAVSALLCIPLIFNRFWPRKQLHWLAIFWAVSVCFCLPFFFVFMSLVNGGSALWLMNTVSAFFFVLMLFDAMLAVFILVVGTVAGVASFWLLAATPFYLNIGTVSLWSMLATFAAALVIGVIFCRNNQVIAQIKRKKLRIEIESRAKSEFIANMSHDLRTPMTGISGMLDGLSHLAKDAETVLHQGMNSRVVLQKFRHFVEKTGEYTHHAKEASTDLIHLFNQILEASKLESQEEEGTFTSVLEVEALFKRSLNLLQPLAQQKNLNMSYMLSLVMPKKIISIPVFIERILSNLIGNAIKFTDKGFVKVRAQLLEEDQPVKAGDKVFMVVEVEDSGVGIPDDKYHSIFDYFTRLSPSYEGIYKGAGLGLYIAKRYTELLHGQIKVQSKLGKGTCFTVTIPVTVAEDELTTEGKQIAPAASSQHDLTTALPAEGAVILLVEDSPIAARAVKLMLKRFPCKVDIASNGEEALQKIRNNQYQLIFMDIGLPDINGIEVSKQIRSLYAEATVKVPVVALTGHADDTDTVEACTNAGIREVITKPIDYEKMKEVLCRLLPMKTC